MLEYHPDWTVFDAPAQTIVNTVNCVGVMGRGLALEVRRRFPDVYIAYVKACRRGAVKVGKLYLVKSKGRWILNFPTKVHWRGRSRIDYIEKGLSNFVATYRRIGITSVAFPALGCGSGGLKWETVKPIMDERLKRLAKLHVYICLAQPASPPGREKRRKPSPTQAAQIQRALFSTE